jgi:Fe2+ transport system protein FeoA
MFRGEIKNKINGTYLNEVSPKDTLIIKSMPEGAYKSQLLRFGLFEGQKVECISKLPGGTMVIGLNRQEIALGAGLTKKILVEIEKAL